MCICLYAHKPSLERFLRTKTFVLFGWRAEGAAGRHALPVYLTLRNVETWGCITRSKTKIRARQLMGALWAQEVCPAQHSSRSPVPGPRGSAGAGANVGPCCCCRSTIGRGRLGRGPGQEDMISSDSKGLFCFRKGSGFHSASLPPSRSLLSLGSLHHLLREHHLSPPTGRASGFEVGRGGRRWLGRSVILSSQRMSFIPRCHFQRHDATVPAAL